MFSAKAVVLAITMIASWLRITSLRNGLNEHRNRVPLLTVLNVFLEIKHARIL
jgi:ABC-type Co2+ transport system permease subunit